MIETLDEWNERLGWCGCCEMPECPEPVMDCEVKYGFIDREFLWDELTYDDTGDYFAGDPIEEPAFHPPYTDVGGAGIETGVMYRKLTRTYEEETRAEGAEDPLPNTAVCSDTVKTVTTYTYGGGSVVISRNIYTLSEPITKEEFAAKAIDEMEAAAWTLSTGVHPYICQARHLLNWAVYPSGWEPCGFIVWSDITFGAQAAMHKIRFRFRIPTTHTGSKFTITYDIAEFPDDGDPSFVSQDNVIAWTGPGTGDSSDPSWLTPWVEIDPPEVPGERRVVNIRYTCYTGTRYGVKPQVMGEALEIPPP